MAERFAFYRKDDLILKKCVTFQWMPGLSAAQKKRSMENMHRAIGEKTLEVSTKSNEELGVRLSAFRLMLDGTALENIFQSSKVFENGGPYRELLQVSPKEAKREERLRTSGKLKGFDYNGFLWPLEPKTAFYDYIYLRAVRESFKVEELRALLEYACFTDIEFNHNKSVNTQARSAAVAQLFIERQGEIPELMPGEFLEFHRQHVQA